MTQAEKRHATRAICFSLARGTKSLLGDSAAFQRFLFAVVVVFFIIQLILKFHRKFCRPQFCTENCFSHSFTILPKDTFLEKSTFNTAFIFAT